MRNRLQYLYSISVFMGALVTAYLMMSNDMRIHVPYRAVKGPQLTNEAGVGPALDSLFEVEKGLGKVEEPENSSKRVPSQMVPKNKKHK